MFKPVYKKTQNYIFKFEPASKSVCDILSPDDCGFSLCVYVYNKHKSCVAFYFKHWKHNVSDGDIYNFIFDFMQNINIRKNLLISGKNIIEFNKNEINIECHDLIKKINKQMNIKDLVYLKTFGHDKISNKGFDELTVNVQRDIVNDVLSTFDNNEDVKNTLRWINRGLTPQNAIYKTKIDKKNKEKFKDR